MDRIHNELFNHLFWITFDCFEKANVQLIITSSENWCRLSNHAKRHETREFYRKLAHIMRTINAWVNMILELKFNSYLYTFDRQHYSFNTCEYIRVTWSPRVISKQRLWCNYGNPISEGHTEWHVIYSALNCTVPGTLLESVTISNDHIEIITRIRLTSLSLQLCHTFPLTSLSYHLIASTRLECYRISNGEL